MNFLDDILVKEFLRLPWEVKTGSCALGYFLGRGRTLLEAQFLTKEVMERLFGGKKES